MINYENVYKLSDFEQAVFAAERKVDEAKRKVEEARNKYRIKCAEIAKVPVDDLEFSNVSCIAKNICSHVYLIKSKYQPHGSPENKCIFCGCDNFDCGY